MTQPQELSQGMDLRSLYDMVLAGGPVMVPIALCSVIALTYAVERFIRLRPSYLGNRRLVRDIVSRTKHGGATEGLALCEQNPSAVSRVLAAGFRRWTGPTMEREKALEDAGAREVDRLSAGLRPLVVIAAIAPLLGLLGTVWGMIESFAQLARDGGVGKPELLAGGISQALITTATGLCIAIPAQAAYYYLKGKIDRFARLAEDTYADLAQAEQAGEIGGRA